MFILWGTINRIVTDTRHRLLAGIGGDRSGENWRNRCQWRRNAVNDHRSLTTDHWPLVILAVTTLLVFVAYLYYNRTFVQHQGRYLFPALVPIALGVALAVDGLLRLARWPDRLRPLTFASPFLVLVALDLYALWRFIIPALA